MNTEKNTDRMVYIDLFRGMSIFLVTGFHLWRYFDRPSVSLWGFDIFAPFRHGDVGVEVFFIISGWCMAMVLLPKHGGKNVDWRSYLLKRLIRIVPAYYVAILFWTIVIVFFDVASKPVGIADQFSHMLFIHTFSKQTYYSISGVFWTIGIEMQFYLVLPLLFAFFIKYSWSLLAVLSIPLVYHSIFSEFFGLKIMDAHLFSKTFLYYLVYFFIGFKLFQKRDDIFYFFKNGGLIFKFLGFAVFAVFVVFLFIKDFPINGHFGKFVLSLSFALGMLHLSYITIPTNFVVKFFAFTGKASYSIYLYNYIFYINGGTAKDLGAHYWIYCFSMTYMFGILMYFLVEKYFNQHRDEILNRFNSSNI